MTLEDFFTLTEMKDGLTAASRVQDLVSIMQKDKTSVVKNIGDATRQWAAVASTISATDNKDCLDVFIQLDGLHFIDRWLKDAQSFSVDTYDSFTEESITALLRALEKLNIDGERSISSGICATVRSLHGHHSSRVRDKARALLNGWKLDEKGDLKSPSLVLVKANSGDEKHGVEDAVATSDDALSKEKGQVESNFPGSVRGENSPPTTTDNIQPVRIADLTSPLLPMDAVSVDTKDQNGDHPSDWNNSVQYSPTMKGSPLTPEDKITSSGTCSFPDSRPGDMQGQSEVSKLKEASNNEKQVQEFNSLPEKPGSTEVSPSSKKVECGSVSLLSDEGNFQRLLREPTSQKNVGDCKSGTCQNVSSVDGMPMTVPDQYSNVDNIRNIPEVQDTARNEDNSSNVLHDLIADGNKSRNYAELEASMSRIASAGVLDEKLERVSNGSENRTSSSDSPPAMRAKSQNVNDKRRPDIELEYGFDALQVARQVAQEVKREVGDRREPFCSSSSEKISECSAVRQPGSPDSIGKQDLPAEVLLKASSSTHSDSTEAYSAGEECAANSENSEPHNGFTLNMASSLIAEASQEPENKSEQGGCIFDLNEEVCSDDIELPVNAASTHIPVVSAPRQASTSGLPAAPLQFEGALGWKGSAATSAFRPASPRKTSDLDKNISLDGTSETSKLRLGGLDIDLNVAEGIDGLEKKTSVASGLPSRESHVEKRSGKLNLDLNSMSDDSEAQMSDPRMERQQLRCNRNGHHNASPASSSSTLQPSIRNIDLNGPYSHNDIAEQGQGKSCLGNSYERPTSDTPVISILGTRVEVNKKDYVHASQLLSFPHGKAIEPTMDFSNARGSGILGIVPTVSYSHPPVFSYDGLTTAPNMSLSPAIYGSGGTIPYMVDSRGAPVMPQIMGSNSTVLPAYSQPPYIMNMSGLQPGLNGVGPSRPHLDLNSGFLIDSGNNESFRQFLVPGGGITLEDHPRIIPQASSSGIVGKRKEPDSGWESYPFNYKHQQPPWK